MPHSHPSRFERLIAIIERLSQIIAERAEREVPSAHLRARLDRLIDDGIPEVLAADVIDKVRDKHPTVDPKARRRIARLYLKQRTGSEQRPGRISMRRLATHLGVSKTLVHNIEHQALAKLWLKHAETLRDEF